MGKVQVTEFEKNILRELAHEYMQIATLDVQRKKMEMWKVFNRVGNMRPMVTIDQLPWHELDFDGSLTCRCNDPFLRSIEEGMRKKIYQWKNFPVDMVVEPFITIPYCASNSGMGIDIAENTAETDQTNDVVSHSYINQLEEEEDLDKIKDIQITLDKETSAEWKAVAEEIFVGIVPVVQAGGASIRLQIWDILAELMNVENVYYDLIDRPEFIHGIMEKMTQSVISGIEQVNALGIFNSHDNLCHCSHIYTDELLPDFAAGKGVTSEYGWGLSMAQLFTSASPATTKEFEIDYMSRISKYYGMFYYGCCERLDDRLDIVQKLPNVRKISCSPWSNPENFAINLDPKIIMSNKPTPAVLVAPSLDTDVVAKHITNVSQIAKKNQLNVEFLLKDVSTVCYKPERLTQWAETTMKIVENM
ncbi:MAG: hypothetical protein R3Y24_10860 [Eubacteriales bacterium]